MGSCCPCRCQSDQDITYNNSPVQENGKASKPKKSLQQMQLNHSTAENNMRSQRPFLHQTDAHKEKNTSTVFQTMSYDNKGKIAKTSSPQRRSRQENPRDDRHNHKQSQRQYCQQQHSSLIKGDSSIEILIQDAFKASNLKSYEQACRLFSKALATLEDRAFREQYNQQSLQQHRILILLELIQIETVRNQRIELERYYEKCLKAFENMPQYKVYENKITLMNNYSLFLREENKLQTAIHLCHKALELQEKYYTRCDLRRYATLTNMACLYNQNGQSAEAENIYQKINLCRDSYTRQIASQNQKLQKMGRKIAK